MTTWRRSLAFALFVSSLACCSALAQLPPPKPAPIVGARMPALSPDGKRLAFVYKGDIWVSDAAGGRATSLTRNTEMDAYPIFSPDGDWVAFSSLRGGNWDIYVVPAGGGEPQRITWHAGSDITYGWRPDGKELLFTTRRDTADAELLAIDLKTRRLRKLAQDYTGMAGANYSPDGKLVVYGRNDFFHWTRPRYVGSGAQEVTLLDVATGARKQVTDNERQHLWTRFLPDGRRLITVTFGEVTPSAPKLGETPRKWTDSPARTPNLWEMTLDGKARQLTHFTGGSVRFPTVAAQAGEIAFEYGCDLWMLRRGQKEPTKVALYASEDSAENPVSHEVLTSGVSEAEPSPDGKLYAFGLRGDIWTIAVEKPKGVEGRPAEHARRLTDWAGDDSDFLWSADGKKLYYRSDREYVTRLFELDLASGKSRSLWTRPEDVNQLFLSPDGKRIAFWIGGAEGGLYTVETATGAIKRLLVMPDPARALQSGGEVSWSPDLQWIAFTATEAPGPVNIWIVPSAGGEPVNVTRLNAYHGQPRWTPDGKYLLFQSNRDGNGLYTLPLTEETARVTDTDIKFEKPKEAVKVAIDYKDITRRIRKLATQNPDGDLTVTPEGHIYFLSGGDVWSLTYDGKDAKRITSGGGCSALRLMKDGKKAFFMRGGDLWSMKLEGSNPQEKVTFTADLDRDMREVRRAAFTQFWSAYNRRFYDPNMHGRDWVATRKRYEPMLEAVETRQEFATLLQMMVGELESSHSEVGSAGGGNPSPTTPHLGFTFDYAYQGPGIKVDTVPEGAPGSFEKTRIRPGEYVLAIDGQDVTNDESLYKLINNRQGREFSFLVNGKPTKEGARTVKYTNLSSGEWGNLLYRNRVERLRQYAEQKSGGKVSYVHIAGMGGSNQTQFERELYEYSIGRKAMIIDVRFNGGGNISDTLVNWLERKPHGFYRPRDGDPEPAPGRAWTLPIVILMNEHSFSNAEMFPSAMRARGLAKLVGMPTPGYVIWTWGLPLVDGTNGRMPGSGVYRLDGTPLEDMGEKPDVRVALSPEDWLAERDPQLDKALEILMK
ncbi:MAG: PD40 domain-containing protein [Chthonomonadales bacterium]|nr:PD40 domain-containing protein [Chthonomonadales bacterium]